jgi:dihydrodipicolinate synthase/N-acetylneuraminate lyase
VNLLSTADTSDIVVWDVTQFNGWICNLVHLGSAGYKGIVFLGAISEVATLTIDPWHGIEAQAVCDSCHTVIGHTGT